MIIAEELENRSAENKVETKAETLAEEAPVEKAPAEETPQEEALVEEAPEEEAPEEEAPEEEAPTGPKFVQQDIFRKKVYLTPEQCAQKALETLVLNKQIETKKAERQAFLANFDKQLQEFDREIAELEEKVSEQGRIALNGEDFDDTDIDVYDDHGETLCVLRGKSVNDSENIIARIPKR